MADAPVPVDPIFPYVQLAIQNLWSVGAFAVAVVVLQNKTALAEFIGRITKLQFSDFSLELAAAQQKLQLVTAQIDDLSKRNAELIESITTDIDLSGPAQTLAPQRQFLKATAANLDDADFNAVMDGLAADASPEKVFAAAVILRSRRKIAYFDNLVACLARLSKDPTLGGNRLNTVWTLTSALHRMLVDQFQSTPSPALTLEQLNDGEQALGALAINPRVIADRPDAPDKGILGPLRHAQNWIKRGRAALTRQDGTP